MQRYKYISFHLEVHFRLTISTPMFKFIQIKTKPSHPMALICPITCINEVTLKGTQWKSISDRPELRPSFIRSIVYLRKRLNVREWHNTSNDRFTPQWMPNHNRHFLINNSWCWAPKTDCL